MKKKTINMVGNDPGGNSPFPWHHFPNVAPETYYMIGGGYHFMEGDLTWNMTTNLWTPITPNMIGKDCRNYYRVARLVSNSQVNLAKRSDITWQPMQTANKHCCPLILKLKNGAIVMGRTQSIGPRYERQGWFQDVIRDSHEFYTTNRRIYPVAWSPLPMDIDKKKAA
jgi:hypothetical protein